VTPGSISLLSFGVCGVRAWPACLHSPWYTTKPRNCQVFCNAFCQVWHSTCSGRQARRSTRLPFNCPLNFKNVLDCSNQFGRLASMKKPLFFESETCSRCGGSGHYSYCQRYGTTCFKCGGRTTVLTKRGEAAQRL